MKTKVIPAKSNIDLSEFPSFSAIITLNFGLKTKNNLNYPFNMVMANLIKIKP